MATRCIQNSFERVNYILYDIAYASRRIQQTQTPAMAALNNAAKQHKVMLTDISEILTFTKL
jgi:ParB family chromosome partitioning protein